MNRNERIYPIYRMFGYDYLFFLVISFLFLTITKGLTVGQVMFIAAFSSIFIAIFQIPTNYLVDLIGLKKSMILGNLLWVIHMVIIIFCSNFVVFIIAEAICSFGTCLKGLSETRLLYSSLKKSGNKDKFSKVEGRGVSWFYYLEALSALFVGFMFEINNYIPMVCTLAFGLIALVTSMCFDEIEDTKFEKIRIKEYFKGFKLVLASSRIVSIFLYSFLMSGLVRVIETLQKSTIVELNVSAMEFSMIFAILTLCVGIGSSIQSLIEKVAKRKTLAIIGYMFASLIIFLGIINIFIKDKDIVLIMSVAILIIQNILSGSYRISVKKYMNNFTTHTVRGKILALFYIFESIGKAILLFVCGIVIDKVGTNQTSIIIGISAIILMIVIVTLMKTRNGLNAEEYSKEDVYGMDISELN